MILIKVPLENVVMHEVTHQCHLEKVLQAIRHSHFFYILLEASRVFEARTGDELIILGVGLISTGQEVQPTCFKKQMKCMKCVADSVFSG
jgi:hypothetical protein